MLRINSAKNLVVMLRITPAKNFPYVHFLDISHNIIRKIPPLKGGIRVPIKQISITESPLWKRGARGDF
jgi:hypothetical protein